MSTNRQEYYIQSVFIFAVEKKKSNAEKYRNFVLVYLESEWINRCGKKIRLITLQFYFLYSKKREEDKTIKRRMLVK